MAGHRRLVAGVDHFGDVDEGIAAVAVGGVACTARHLFQGVPQFTTCASYLRSPYAASDHSGLPPVVLFVFESARADDVFLNAASWLPRAPLASATTAVLDEHGVLGSSWLMPAPVAPERRFLVDLRELTKCQPVRTERFP